MDKIWTMEEEIENLRARFVNINRAKFARDNDLKGGGALIYQHLRGDRPISLEAAKAYARGFDCSLDEISPRLAHEAYSAISLSVKPVLEVREDRPAYGTNTEIDNDIFLKQLKRAYSISSPDARAGLEAMVQGILKAHDKNILETIEEPPVQSKGKLKILLDQPIEPHDEIKQQKLKQKIRAEKERRKIDMEVEADNRSGERRKK